MPDVYNEPNCGCACLLILLSWLLIGSTVLLVLHAGEVWSAVAGVVASALLLVLSWLGA